MDFISATFPALDRDLVYQGRKMLLVRTVSGGALVADRFGTCVIESEIRRINGILYMQGDVCHMEWWAVFVLGTTCWLAAAIVFL
ncbi:MAG: hypothetical protein JNJ60_15965 [Rhodocyclaceae bacterium]|nr:hypothetical protein [Rhodocyclaceae bacterium]